MPAVNPECRIAGRITSRPQDNAILYYTAYAAVGAERMTCPPKSEPTLRSGHLGGEEFL
jgi:hypothetical protein